ncbi:MAG: gliding motility-associated C-terminal domain-containing protein [Prolixibacteraceae bacterium]|nr:gliding motility-associated C-terminal domain-containing protein [Prolixibacteraceae bacterium]
MDKTFFIFLLITVWLFTGKAEAQLTAPGSSATVTTQYPVFQETDDIFIFCTSDASPEIGTLQVNTTIEGTKTMLWEKYNNQTSTFESYLSESTDGQQSTITGLPDGCYRVTVTAGTSEEVYRGWVINNYFSAEAKISQSDCESFTLEGSYTSSTIRYYDLADNSELEITKEINTEWSEKEVLISSLSTIKIFELPDEDTDYNFRVYDQFGCEANSTINYRSVATVADFSAEPMNGEAPLTVTFNNLSKNSDQYIWSFFRNLDEIKRDSENSQQPVDSIMIVAYDENPVYTYENSGSYMVKLVSIRVTDTLTCADTTYLEDYIMVDTSFVAVPNVFTPNGDGTNDLFVVKFWSMQNIKIEIFNRWGKRLHFWESDDVRGFEDTYTATVWDGRVGGRYASPGVYYYVIEGMGRDNEKRRARGFFHLFRDKQ